MRRRLQINARPDTQLQKLTAHPTKRMRNLVKLFAVTVLVVLVLSISGVGAAAWDKLLFYGHVARLYTREPDSRLSMPLQDVLKRQVGNTWHAPRGTDRLHEGQDIFAPKGTPIYSATSGFVYNVGENNLGGQTVSVIGDGGRVYYYAHLDSYAPGIAVGESVTRQTLLGYVGTTGNAQGTPPHLHFGVYTSNGAINPLPLLVDRAQTAVTTRSTQRRIVNRKA
jgi:murein DD-endopeptidase MepM/ murein hydrolase activator NlpD